MNDHPGKAIADRLVEACTARSARIGVIGLGYVGLPLAVACARVGYPTIGFDIDPDKPRRLNAGESYIDTVPSDALRPLVEAGTFLATDDFTQLEGCDVIVICVPTPLSRHREPDLSYVEATARTIADNLQRGQLVVLESTSYPGTTREVVVPVLERTGLLSGRDFLAGFSPEREDHGNADYSTATIPKVVAGDGPEASRAIRAFYDAVMERTVVVSSPDVAEAVKITENVFRAVNIALVNELKTVYHEMGIDVWEVIEAASTKPFGYMPFWPGPGLGGHCIPIDPFYLTWKAREHEIATRFIELAGEINVSMPRYVVRRLEEELNGRFAKPLNGARILLLGVAYKRNVGDDRESPAYRLIELIEARGAKAGYHDPHVPEIKPSREHAALAGRRSVELSPTEIAGYDAVLVVTDHADVDYAAVVANAKMVVDTRNACAAFGADNVVKA